MKRVFLTLEKRPPAKGEPEGPTYQLVVLLGGADKPVCNQLYWDLQAAQGDLATHADGYAMDGYQVNVWETVPKPDTVRDWLAALPTRTLLYELRRRGPLPLTKAGRKSRAQAEDNLLDSLG